MKKTIKFGYLLALLVVPALFACNPDDENENEVVNDSAFVGTWKLKSMDISTKIEVLDSLGKVTETIDPWSHENPTYTNATIEFKEDYTALSVIRDGDAITTGAYKWEDLGEQLVLKSYTTYEKVQTDTFAVAKSGTAVTLKTQRKEKTIFQRGETVQVDDSTTTTVTRRYNANLFTNVTINIDK